MTIKDTIKKRLKDNNVRYWANDNIADYIEEGEKQQLIDEAVPAFENMLDHLLIDTKTDPKNPPHRSLYWFDKVKGIPYDERNEK